MMGHLGSYSPDYILLHPQHLLLVLPRQVGEVDLFVDALRQLRAAAGGAYLRRRITLAMMAAWRLMGVCDAIRPSLADRGGKERACRRRSGRTSSAARRVC